jgi:hypothetical protein
MVQEAVAAGVTVVVESDDAVRHVDMVSREALGRNDPFCMKSFKRAMLEENTCKNVACAVTEEDAIRQRPSSLRISLYAMLEDIHVRSARVRPWAP